MSRSKKSRKPGTGSIGIVKDEKKKEKEVATHSRKPKNKSGKQPGNRQQEAFNSGDKPSAQTLNKDPRIGSKKLIDLGAPTKKPPQQFKAKSKVKADTSPIAAIRVIEPETPLEDELYAIEDDAQLQVILNKQDDDIELTEVEINYFNEKMARHQTLRELLGLSDEDDEDDDNKATKSNSEDDLWDKLDNSDLSDY
jgi:ribosome assembly protein YihI (activator of Der GTPase)